MKSMEKSEQSNTLTNAEEQNKQNYSDEIINRQKILTTPFEAIRIDDGENLKKNFIVWGAHRITEFLSEEELVEKIQRLEDGYADWDMIATIAGTITIEINKEKK